jgi:ariadne-1
MDDYYEYENEYGYYSEQVDNLSLSLTRQSSGGYNIVKNSDLESIRNKIINECQEFTCLSHDEATIVLIQFQWNLERIKDQWYEDVEGNMKKYGLDLNKTSQVELAKKKVKPNNRECLVCYSPFDETFFSLNCRHNFCGDCWSNYLESRLEDILTYTTKILLS